MRARATAVLLIALAMLAACREHVPERREEIAAGVPLDIENGPAAVLSPDGKRLVLVADRLYLRALDAKSAAPLEGTEGARDPFFSPDGNFIAYFSKSQLMKIPVTGGSAVALCDVESPRGGAWTQDGAIIFATIRGGLLEV